MFRVREIANGLICLEHSVRGRYQVIVNELIEKAFFLKIQNLGRGVVRENGSLRTSRSSLLHKLEKIVRIIFKVMEINLKFAVI